MIFLAVNFTVCFACAMGQWWQKIWRTPFSQAEPEPKNDESTDTPSIVRSLDEAGILLEKVTGKSLRHFSTRDFGRERFTEAKSVLVEESQGERLLTKIRRSLGPGLVAFLGTRNSHAKPRPEGVELVVGHGTSQFDILRIAASDAVNFNKDTEDLVKQIQAWDTAYGVDIFQADTDTIQLRLLKIPPNLNKFAEEVYEFCPDIVDQGVGSVDRLAKDIGATRKLFLWWD